MQIYSLTVLEVGSLNWARGLCCFWRLRGESDIFLFGFFRILEATYISCVVDLQYSDLCFHSHVNFFLTLTLLPPPFKDPCDYFGLPWLIQDYLPTSRAFIFNHTCKIPSNT